MTHLSVIWIISSRNVLIFSMIDNKEIIYHCFFCIQFVKQCVSIVFQCALDPKHLASTIERRITLVGDVCFKPPIRFHDLHVG
jgi:hypothetical protein